MKKDYSEGLSPPKSDDKENVPSENKLSNYLTNNQKESAQYSISNYKSPNHSHLINAGGFGKETTLLKNEAQKVTLRQAA